MHDNWQIRIDRPLDSMTLKVYIFRNTMTGGGTRCRQFVTNLATGEIRMIEHGVGDKIADIKPTIELDERFAEGILTPLVRALVKDGIQVTEPSTKAKDELSATKYHLEDMRELLAHITELRPKLVLKRQEAIKAEF